MLVPRNFPIYLQPRAHQRTSSPCGSPLLTCPDTGTTAASPHDASMSAPVATIKKRDFTYTPQRSQLSPGDSTGTRAYPPNGWQALRREPVVRTKSRRQGACPQSILTTATTETTEETFKRCSRCSRCPLWFKNFLGGGHQQRRPVYECASISTQECPHEPKLVINADVANNIGVTINPIIIPYISALIAALETKR